MKNITSNEKPPLPEGWEWVRLGEIIDSSKYGYTARANDDRTGVPYLRITDINEDGSINIKKRKYVQVNDEIREKYRLRDNDIVIARSGSVGISYLYNEKDGEMIYASYLIRFRINPNIALPKFIFYHFHSPFYWRFVENTKRKAAQVNINATELKNLEIPLPPLPIQKQIVEKLDTLMASIENAKKLHEQSEDLTNTLMQAAIQHEFARAEEEGWEWKRLGETLFKKETRNPTKSPDEEFYYVDISSVDNSEFRIKYTKKIIGREAPSRARKVIRKNDVIFATTRPYLKSIAIVPEKLDNQICSTGFCVCRAKTDKIDFRYLFYYLIWDKFIESLLPKMRGSSYPAITDNDIYTSEITLPPLPVQKQIVEKLDGIRAMVESLKWQQKERSDWLDKLPKALLEKAFRGEL